jgi:hypothetical protein
VALRRAGVAPSDVTSLAIDVAGADLVAPRRVTGRGIGVLVGVSRLAMGGAFLARPVASVRLLGVDSATATRVAWLARMTAARDAALGAGTLASLAGRRGHASWLTAGVITDAADAAAIALAVRSGRLDRIRGSLAAGLAAAGAVAGAGAVVGVLRRR